MAKAAQPKGTKTQLVEELLATGMRTSDIVKALAEQGVEITPTYVSKIKGVWKNKSAAAAPAAPAKGRKTAPASMVVHESSTASKTDLVRGLLSKGVTKASDIVEALGKQGVTVSPAYIYAIAKKFNAAEAADPKPRRSNVVRMSKAASADAEFEREDGDEYKDDLRKAEPNLRGVLDALCSTYGAGAVSRVLHALQKRNEAIIPKVA